MRPYYTDESIDSTPGLLWLLLLWPVAYGGMRLSRKKAQISSAVWITGGPPSWSVA